VGGSDITERPQISAFFDECTNSFSYLVADPVRRQAAVIDPVLDFDAASGEIHTQSAERILAAANKQGLSIGLVLETHPHADHLTAAPFFRERIGARVAIGSGVREVQKTFAPMFRASDVKGDGGDFDLLLEDGQSLPLGELVIEVIATPGHTPACVSYKVGDAVFVGDTLFMPDYGTARTDFPGGDARQLYRSIHKLLALPPETRLFMCHDYKCAGRDQVAWETTVADQRAGNVHIGAGISEDDYVAMRETRDSTLSAPKLLLPAIQVNIRAGRMPPAEENGVSYLKIPITVE
jgi:glyoxylase-like metal-dependent hydrolase (beta-lactamase superfamily II)